MIINLLKSLYEGTGLAIDKNGNEMDGIDALQYYDRLLITYGTTLFKKFPNTTYTHNLHTLQEAVAREKERK